MERSLKGTNHLQPSNQFALLFRIDMKTGKSVAIKVVNLDADHEGIDEIRREVSVLCHCDSAYIIKYHESILVGSRLWIVMDYCGFGSLRQIIVLSIVYHSFSLTSLV